MEPLQQKFRLKKCIRIISGQNNDTQGGENERERERGNRLTWDRQGQCGSLLAFSLFWRDRDLQTEFVAFFAKSRSLLLVHLLAFTVRSSPARSLLIAINAIVGFFIYGRDGRNKKKHYSRREMKTRFETFFSTFNFLS